MAVKASVRLPRKCVLQNCCGQVFNKRWYADFLKKEKNRCAVLVGFEAPNQIQP